MASSGTRSALVSPVAPLESTASCWVDGACAAAVSRSFWRGSGALGCGLPTSRTCPGSTGGGAGVRAAHAGVRAVAVGELEP
jgi:hypothetical protein